MNMIHNVPINLPTILLIVYRFRKTPTLPDGPTCLGRRIHYWRKSKSYMRLNLT